MGSSSLRHGFAAAVQIALAIAIFLIAILLAEVYNQRFDLSPTQHFVLSDASQRVAAGLKIPVKVTAFFSSQEQGQRREMIDVLQLFHKAAPDFTFQLNDLDRNPAMAQKYNVSNANSGVLSAGDKSFPLRGVDEEEITTALLKLTRTGERKLCFIIGHGERNPFDNNDRTGYSEVGKALEADHIGSDILENVPSKGIPAECTAVVLAGPTKEFLTGELGELEHYVDNGGQVLLLIDPIASKSAETFLADFGVRAGNDVVMDERNRLMGTDSSMLQVPAFNPKLLRAELDAAVFPVARTLFPIDDEVSRKTKVYPLAYSSEESWAYVMNDHVLPERDAKFRREIDKPGPFPVGLLITIAEPTKLSAPDTDQNDTPKRQGRVLVFGDSDFGTNLALGWRGNKDLFLSAAAVLVEDSELIAVRHKSAPKGTISPIYLTERQDSIVFWIAVVLVPGTVAIVGTIIATRRRRRSGR